MFYAFVSLFGNNMRSAEDNKRIGRVAVFDNKNDRDFFIMEDAQMRESISSCEARYYIIQRLAAEGYDTRELYCNTMCELVDLYVRLAHLMGGF